MENTHTVRSPAQRARRCVTGMLALTIVAAGAYLALHDNRAPISERATIVASSSMTADRLPTVAPATDTAAK